MRHREGERPVPGYKLESFLGEGGYGEVWRAIGPGGVPCALKFIKLDSKQGLKELKSIGLVKRLRHPNLVPLNAVWLRDEDGNTMSSEGDGGTQSLSFRVYGDKELVIAMGLGSGSLADRLAAARSEKAPDALPGGLSLRKLLGYMQDAARGIDCLNDPAAHDNPGVMPLVHCDIKPANLLLVGGGVQVCDYGVAKAVGKDIKKTMAAGTAAYAPPELINNDPGPGTDQYSLAISYYELRTGHLPLDETKAMMAHLMGMLDFNRVPADEREVLQQATAMKVADRFPSCEEFVEALHIATGRTIAGGSGPRQALSGSRLAAQPDTSSEIELPPAPPPKPRPTSDVLRPAGSPVAGYTLEKMLGQGGYGQVWQALDEDGVPCALKVLRDVMGKGRHEYETLVHLRKLDHPNLLHIERLWVLDEFWAPIPAEQLGQPGGREARRLVIRTPLADKNLFQRLTECRRHSQPGIPPHELLKYLRQAADALDYLNIAQQTQHRDVKPENLLLKGETLWVSDFGLAKVVPTGGTAAQSTSSGMTQEYASPEVLTNKQVTDRSDQYSLAVTYHVLRTGRLPFPPGLSMLDLIKARATGSLDLSDLTEAERPVLRRALSAYPGDRFDTCRELMRELGQALHMTTTGPLPAAPYSAPVGRPAPDPVPLTPSAVAPAYPPPPPPLTLRRAGPPQGTIEFPTTETRVKFEADPLEPEPTAEFVESRTTVPHSARQKRPPVTGFVDDEPAGGGGKVLVGGLAAAAVIGLGAVGYFVATGGFGTPPTKPDVVRKDKEQTPPSDGGDGKGNGGAGDSGSPATKAPKQTPEEVWAPVRRLIAAGGKPADLPRALDGLPIDVPQRVKESAQEWRRTVDQLVGSPPADADLERLAKVAGDFDPDATPGVLDADRLRELRRAVIARYAEPVVRRLDKVGPNDWAAIKRALAKADQADEWVKAGLAEAALETGETPPAFAGPDGFAGYLQAISRKDADALAGVKPDADWLTPRRAGRMAGLLAEAVEKAGGTAKPEWRQTAELAARKAGPDGEAILKRLATGTAVARLADLRKRLADLRSSPDKLAAEVLPQLTDRAKLDELLGTNPTEAARREAAGLLADAGRELFRHRDKWAGVDGFGSATGNATRAARLFEEAAPVGARPEDSALQGLALLLADRKTPVAPLASLARAGGDTLPGRALTGVLAGLRREHDTALAQLRRVIEEARAEPTRHHLVLFAAYRQAGVSAVAAAHAKDAVNRRGLINEAIGWGRELAALAPDRADGPLLAGCGCEDQGWLLRHPFAVADRCRDDGPYGQADGWFRKAEPLAFDIPGAVATNRGRNLFRWAEDKAQLGKWAADDTAKSVPNDQWLREAERVLTVADRGGGQTADEARHWLAEVALLRYEASERGLTGAGDPQARLTKAVAAVRHTQGKAGAANEWQVSGTRLVEIPLAAARRLQVDGRLDDAASAASRAALAAERVGLPKAAQADAHWQHARLLLAVEETDDAKQAARFARARDPLSRAVELAPQAPALWEWRFALGRVEMSAARQAKAANPGRAAARYVVAFNHLRDAQIKGYLQGKDRPAVDAAYREAVPRIGKFYDEIEAFIKADDGWPGGLRAACSLAKLELQIELDRKITPAQRQEAATLLGSVGAAKSTLDRDLVTAAEEIAGRIRELR